MIAPRFAIAALGAVLYAQAPHAQTAAPGFAAASVKANTSGHNGMGNKFDPGMARWTNYPLSELIGDAYGLRNYQTFGWPEWLGSDKWDIDAATDGPTTYTQKHRMLQTLIEERFHLKFHREMRDLQGYSLVIAKGGPKLHEVKEGEAGAESAGINYNRGRIIARRTPMFQWLFFLSGELRCPFEDNTGLKGKYDFKLEWAPDEIQPNGGGEASADPNRPSIFAALQEQLGLKLEVKKFSVEMFVIDHVEKIPTAN
jgi:uncharacterized protein (TIGR03435 family)